MDLSRQQIEDALRTWKRAWQRHDLDGVMALFDDAVRFENWTGAKAVGKANLRAAWAPWFSAADDFQFVDEETFIDVEEQKVLYRWRLEWPSREKGFEGRPEKRRGVDVLHFRNGKITQKLTYSKTTLEIDGRRQPLQAQRQSLD